MSAILLIGYRQGLVLALQKLMRKDRKQGEEPKTFTVWPGRRLLAKERNYSCIDLPFPRSYADLLQSLPALEAAGPFDRIIPCTEGAVPLTAALNRLWRLPGHSPLQLLRCHDKFLMKQFLAAHHVPMTPFIGHRPSLRAQDLFQALGSPVVCKERGESGGRSLRFCSQYQELDGLLGPRKLYERYVAAPEYSIETIRVQGRSIFCNITQYYEKQHINIVPALLSEARESELKAFNENVLNHLAIENGLTHLEIYLTRHGPLFGEIALRPPGGYIMDLLSIAYGFSSWEAYAAVLQGRPFKVPERPHRWAAAHIFHPGAGELQAVHGWQRARRDPSVIKARLKASCGDRIAKRYGLGQDIGYILQTANDPESLLDAVQRVQGAVEFEVGT